MSGNLVSRPAALINLIILYLQVPDCNDNWHDHDKTFSITAFGEYLIQSDLNHWCLWNVFFFFKSSEAGDEYQSLFAGSSEERSNTSASTECSSKQHQCILGVWSECISSNFSEQMIKNSVFSAQYNCIIFSRHQKKVISTSQSNEKPVFKYISFFPIAMFVYIKTLFLYLIMLPIKGPFYVLLCVNWMQLYL